MTLLLVYIYRILTTLFHPFYRFLIVPKRLQNGKEDPQRYLEKFAFTSLKKSETQKCVWFHAASVGESLSLLKLIEAFIEEYPTWTILLTTGTITSAKIVEQRFPKQVIHQYAPLDFMPVIKRFLSHWEPDLMVWVESELWPTLIFQAHKQKIPLILLNMRLSTRSFQRWVFLRGVFLDLLNCFNLVLTQTKALDQNLKHIGYKKSDFCGNLKYAAGHSAAPKGDLVALQTALTHRSLWMAASTHKGEEDILLKSHKNLQKNKKEACLILVIRHPHRCPEVEQLIQEHDLTVHRYSAWKEKKEHIDADVLLVDQIGVMGLFYNVSPFVFVGGSLINGIGGHNLTEPMRQNCVTLHGPYMENFKEIVTEATQAEATLMVHDSHGLSNALLALMDNPKTAQTHTKNAALFLQNQPNVLANILEQLDPYLTNLLNPQATDKKDGCLERA